MQLQDPLPRVSNQRCGKFTSKRKKDSLQVSSSRKVLSPKRIVLAPGERKKVEFDLPAEVFAIWNDRNEFAVEQAKVWVWVSPDSARGSPVELEILQ
jgi:hypothetical protein